MSKKYLQPQLRSPLQQSRDQLFREVTAAIDLVLQSFQAGIPMDLNLIDRLAHLAVNEDKTVAAHATDALFSELIEVLCDDFSSRGMEETATILVQLLDFIRTLPQGAELDNLLRQYGYLHTNDILARHKALCSLSPLSQKQKQKVSAIILLSRVSAGADIAITAVIFERLRCVFPDTEIYLVGPRHLREIFLENKHVHCLNFIYKNEGTLFDKISTWPALHSLITKTVFSKSSRDTVLLFDPDSRLSQLGLLPLAADHNTFYFPSRCIGESDDKQKNLSYLTHLWMNDVLDTHEPFKQFRLFPNLEDGFQQLRQRLMANGCQHIITINFGVGSDPKKQIDSDFEANLLETLLKRPSTVIILDSGRGPDEITRTREHIHWLTRKGISSCCLNKEIEANFSDNHGIIFHNGPLGNLGKLIKISDWFIGYDSCGQHIASAAGTPSVIIFAGAPSKRFVARWSPGDNKRTTIPIYRDSFLGKRELDSLLANVVEAVSREVDGE